MKISISVDIDDAMEMLNGMARRSRNFTPTFEKARLYLQAANAENFGTGGLPVGGWAPRQQPAGWPLMMRTGKLVGSLTSLQGPPNRIGPFSAEFGTEVDYAHFHQGGTTKMPSRKIVFEPRGFARKVGNDAADHIVGVGE